MWQPVSIRLKNIFTHEDTLFVFLNGEMTLITGKMGSGKSSIAEAITLAITGKTNRGVSKERFIRYNQEQGEVEFKLVKGNEGFAIHRTFFNGNKATQTKIFDNGEQVRLDKLNISVQQYIYDTIGIKEEDLLNYYIIGQGNDNSFYGSTDTAQKEVIARFSNYGGINNVLEHITNEIKEVNDTLLHLEKLVANKEGAIESLQTELKDLVLADGLPIDDRKKQIKAEMRQTEAEITRLEAALAKCQDGIKQLKNQQVKAKKDFVKLNVQHYNDEFGREQVEEEIASCKQQLREADKVFGTLEIMTGKIIPCPKCGFQFIPGGEHTPKQVEDNKELLRQFVLQCDTDLREAQKTLEGINERGSLYETLSDTVDGFAVKIEEAESNKFQLAGSVVNSKTLLLQQQVLLKQLEEQDNASQANKIKDRIRTLNHELAKLQEQVAQVGVIKTGLEFQEYHFGKQGFKTFLANKSIKVIQDITNYYLDRFQTDLQVYISPITALKSGEVRDRIEVSIVRGGVEKGTYNGFSGGEKSIVDICGIIALHKIMNNSTETGGLDLLFMDEKIRHLDSDGQLEIIRIFEKSKITSALILHHADNIQCKNRRYFVKENKITKVYDNPRLGKKI